MLPGRVRCEASAGQSVSSSAGPVGTYCWRACRSVLPLRGRRHALGHPEQGVPAGERRVHPGLYDPAADRVLRAAVGRQAWQTATGAMHRVALGERGRGVFARRGVAVGAEAVVAERSPDRENTKRHENAKGYGRAKGCEDENAKGYEDVRGREGGKGHEDARGRFGGAARTGNLTWEQIAA